MGLAGKSSIYFLLSKTHCAVWAEVALSMQVKKSYQTADLPCDYHWNSYVFACAGVCTTNKGL